MMPATTQHYWRDSALPFVELRSTYDSLQHYKAHFHPQLSLGAMTAGKTRANCNGHVRTLEQGDLVLIAPHVVHACNPIADQPRSYHMLYLDAVWCLENVLPPGASLAEVCGTSRVIRDISGFAQYQQLVASLPDSRPSEVVVRLRCLLRNVLASSSSIPPLLRRQPLGERIKQALLDNIASPPSLDELAAALGCRKETLIRVFRRTFHTTPHAFVNNARIELAKQRLKVGEKIAHVAADLGFSDQAQLHRTFVSYTASTPGEYRRAQPTARINFRQ